MHNDKNTQSQWTGNRLLFITIGLILASLVASCGRLNPSWGPLLYNVSVTPDSITPNADGDQDVTRVSYSLRRSANVSIYFTNDLGEHFYFRQDRRRARGDYTVLWGGTADESEFVESDYGPWEILSRVLPDGTYTWTLEATEENGNTEMATGTINLQDGDSELPELRNFAVVPDIFRPNQDGLADDAVSISYYLTKDVDSLVVYLIDPAAPNVKYFITQQPGLTDPTEAGYKGYRYEADVDRNAEPPPDGTYALIGEARDRAGNAVRVTRELTIIEGGQPFAEIAQGEIDWYVLRFGASLDEAQRSSSRTLSMNLGDQLCFRAIVHNYGTTPIRTAGPWPDQEYQFTENRNTLALRRIETTRTEALPEGDQSWLRQTGVWRFGVNFESTGVDFPFRWAIGRHEDLERRLIEGNEQWYLLPGEWGEVTGCITIDQPPPLNTNTWWGGLIHEDVAVVNNNIDSITVVVESPANALPMTGSTPPLTTAAAITITESISVTEGITVTTP